MQKQNDHPLFKWVTYQGINSDHIWNFISTNFEDAEKWKFYNEEYIASLEILTKLLKWLPHETQKKLLNFPKIKLVINQVFIFMKTYFSLTTYRYPRNIYW
jgi:hypothetical protein